MNWDESLVFLPGRGETHVDAQAARNQISVVEGKPQNKGSCTVDLKLGGLGDFDDGFTHRKLAPPPPPAVASPEATRRSRSCNHSHQAAACIVDDCSADLSGCKDYHKKHKVCEAHSKAVKVTMEGVEKRFCQQCSKFHALSEFDEVKRSCRKRLEGHNKRRRKSHPDLSAASSFANIQGSRFPSYINQHNYPSAILDHGWTAGFFKSDEESVYNQQQQHMMPMNRHRSFVAPSSNHYKDGCKQFPFSQAGDIKLGKEPIETSVCQPLASNTVSAHGSSSRIYSSGLIRVIDSDCALSLLSSSTQSSGFSGLNNIDQIPMALPLVQGMQQFNSIDRFPMDNKVLTSSCRSTNDIVSSGFSCTGIVDDQVGSILVTNTDHAEFHSPEMLQHVGDVANSVSGGFQPLHFSWQ